MAKVKHKKQIFANKPTPGGAQPTQEDIAQKKQARGRQRRTEKIWKGDCLAVDLCKLGLRVRKVEADGNCFFRALGDQLEGEKADHLALRQKVVDHIAANEEQFSPFVEDEEPFATYCCRMRKDSTWAGHLELQAASLVLSVNITVHQAEQPAWKIKNFPEAARTLHLSYHDGEHYNSVRLASDLGTGPAEPIPLLPTTPAINMGKEHKGGWEDEDEERVMQCTGMQDAAVVRQTLLSVSGNVDEVQLQAIERLIDDGAANHSSARAASMSPTGGVAREASTGPVSLPDIGRVSPAEAKTLCEDASASNPSSPQPMQVEAAANAGDLHCTNKGAKLQKKPARNRRCPCGSKLVYKNCCGAAAAAANRRQALALNTAHDAGVAVEKMTTLYI